MKYFALLAAVLLEALGSYASIIGWSDLVGFDLLVVGLVIALDMAKFVVVTYTYKQWLTLNSWLLRYLLFSIVVTMFITSFGAFSYLSSKLQAGAAPVIRQLQVIDELSEQLQKTETRIAQIDTQVANLPADFSSGRIRLMQEFKDEKFTLQSRAVELTQQITSTKNESASVHNKLVQLSNATGVSVETSSLVVTLLIISVFDPLAVVLILLFNTDKRVYRKKGNSKSLSNLFAPKEQEAEVVKEKPKSKRPVAKKSVKPEYPKQTTPAPVQGTTQDKPAGLPEPQVREYTARS